MRVSRILGIVAAAAVALPLAACSGGAAASDQDSNTASAEGFPVTIEHAYGETVIEDAPERVATVAWANHEVPLALGVVPVGMAKATWGDDDADGVLPWVEDQLEELGAETPVLFDETDGIDFDAVNETQPDVILAAYSGLTQEEYDRLSKIAPVVAFPDVAWGTTYEQMIQMSSQALGLAEEGDALIEELHGTVNEALEAHPELADTALLFSYIDVADLSQIGFYTSHDTRPGFFEGLGLPAPSIVAEETEGTDAFYVTVSSEQADRFADVDVFVTYGDPEGDTIEQLQADPLLSKIPAIANGNIAILADNSPLAASANPSPLSIGWGIDEYFAVLAAATQANS
ncbi:iron-siderophore ABC transporter substrate-binding protein [Leucobacter denitrificans]|uniref:Iron-siderophore ABC transporter substrate-binding protein n=1 Tax=Leucobacter denitrificans TaxID=683042 RepID=A0A7G9S741_9MICO|nr:iron-siderophore ABC transporter substrate-binding protein [Leucobacter denitrificans]QNN63666.1 iron-siderophore ABC transporter substrate-binding protein [Leucobacter denitrificans]